METNLSRIRKSVGGLIIEPAVRLLSKTPVTPGAVSWAGFLLTVAAAFLIALDYLFAGGVLVLVGGFLDMLDGGLARRTNRVTPSGGVLDSTLDRLSEAVLFLGILVLFLLPGESTVFAFLGREWSILLVFVTLVTSQMVSYVRARAETAGIECQVGLFTRSERVVVLILGLWLNQIAIALAVIAVLSFITMCQRIVHVARAARN